MFNIIFQRLNTVGSCVSRGNTGVSWDQPEAGTMGWQQWGWGTGSVWDWSSRPQCLWVGWREMGEDAGSQHLAPMGLPSTGGQDGKSQGVEGTWGAPELCGVGRRMARPPAISGWDPPVKAEAAISVKVSVSPQQRAGK